MAAPAGDAVAPDDAAEGGRAPDYVDASRPELGERQRFYVGESDLARDPSRERDDVPDARGPVHATQHGEQRIEILTELRPYFELDEVKSHLLHAWAFVTVFDMAGSVYNYGGFEGKADMDRVQYTSVMAEVYSKSFCFGIICTALGHHLANAKNKEKKRRLPFVDPRCLDAFPLCVLPRGTTAVVTVFMGVFWATIMGSGLAALVLLLWFLMGASFPPRGIFFFTLSIFFLTGMNHEKHAMNGAWYSLYSAACSGFFAPVLMAVGLIQGATDMPGVVKNAFERQQSRDGGGAAPSGGKAARVLALSTRQTITIVRTPWQLWHSFSTHNKSFFFFLVFSLTAVGTAFTYASVRPRRR